MRTALGRITSTHLAVYVAIADAIVWLGALPFELYCRNLVAAHRADTAVLLLILLANALLLALMAEAITATSELVRRGFARSVRALVPVLIRTRSKPTAR